MESKSLTYQGRQVVYQPSEQRTLTIAGRGGYVFVDEQCASALVGRSLAAGEVVVHKDGDLSNCALENLAVTTPAGRARIEAMRAEGCDMEWLAMLSVVGDDHPMLNASGVCACGKPKTPRASLCIACRGEDRRMRGRDWGAPDGRAWVGEEILARLASESFAAVGRSFGISDNAVRKRLRLEGLGVPRRRT